MRNSDDIKDIAIYGTLIVHRSYIQNIKVINTQKINILNKLFPKNLHKTYIFNGSIINDQITFNDLIMLQGNSDFDENSICDMQNDNEKKMIFILACVLSQNEQSIKFYDINCWLKLTLNSKFLEQKLNDIKNKKYALEKARIQDISLFKKLFQSNKRISIKNDINISCNITENKNLQHQDQLIINYLPSSSPSEMSLPILW